jgi:esterase/lipase superfamily enzyme
VPKYWRISDRAIIRGQPSSIQRGPLTFWIADKLATDGTIAWEQISQDRFRKLLIVASDAFPVVEQFKDQPHVTFFIHGYNVGWQDSSKSYQNLCTRMFEGGDSLGLCVSFDWPSYGNILGYYPDRAHARECAQDLTDILSDLFDWLVKKQDDARKFAVATAQGKKPKTEPCKAKVSVISHSMGNYVMQKAMAAAWTRKNQPLLISLVNQLLMVAADVDNNVFDMGAPDNNDGSAIANLTYRITALYSGRDGVLGASAGLKHFGIRRLGRSGLANRPPVSTPSSPTDNVWDIDCSNFFPATVNGMDIHGAYFVTDATIDLMRQVLKGLDRDVLVDRKIAPPPKS